MHGRRGGSGWHSLTVEQRTKDHQARTPHPPIRSHVGTGPTARRLLSPPGNAKLAVFQAQYVAADGVTARAELQPRNSDEFPSIGGAQRNPAGARSAIACQVTCRGPTAFCLTTKLTI